MEPTAPDVLDPLNFLELQQVKDYLLSTDLEIIEMTTDSLEVNYIWRVELLPPPKAQVLAYFAGGLRPERRAKAYVFMGAEDPPVVRELSVGPLGSSPPSNWTVLAEHPYNMRSVDEFEYALRGPIISEFYATVKPLTMESYGMSGDDDCSPPCINWSDNGPRGYYRSNRETWIWSLRTTEGWYLEPLGLEFQLVHNGPDPSEWHITQVVYMGQWFPNVNELMEAYNNGSLTVYHMDESKLNNTSPRFSTMRERGEQFPSEDRQGSSRFQPQGDRFAFSGRRFTWMGWSFTLGYSPHGGVVLWDLRYENERVIYEMALNEAYVAYSGYGAIGTNTIYQDCGWGFGTSLTPLARGVDCPTYALMVDQPYWSPGGPDTPPGPAVMPQAVCIFEDDPALAIYRHYEVVGEDQFYSGVKDHRLVIRTSSSVWNYDYMIDVRLGVDGTIDVEGTSSGYIQAGNALQEALNNPDDQNDRGSDYGYKVHEYTWGHLHEHMLHYKIDFDIVDTANSFENIAIKTRTVNRPWYTGVPGYAIQKYAERVIEQTELGMKMSPESPHLWVILNQQRKNRWGNPRGYRVQILGTIHQALPDDHPYLKAGAFTKYNLAVTHYHDSESTDTHAFDMQAPAEPISSLDNYLDGEAIEQQDLVAWITVGSFHLPVAEDIPNTVMPGSYGRFLLRSHNFFDENPSARLRENVFITLTDGERLYDQYGLGDDGECQVPEFVLTYLGAEAPHN